MNRKLRALVEASNSKNFDDSNLQDASFNQAKLSGTIFHYAKMKDCDFEGADLSGSNFMEASFANADFMAADFSGADFSKARGLDQAIWPKGYKLVKG